MCRMLKLTTKKRMGQLKKEFIPKVAILDKERYKEVPTCLWDKTCLTCYKV